MNYCKQCGIEFDFKWQLTHHKKTDHDVKKEIKREETEVMIKDEDGVQIEKSTVSGLQV
jgi:hypothetical protein